MSSTDFRTGVGVGVSVVEPLSDRPEALGSMSRQKKKKKKRTGLGARIDIFGPVQHRT